MSYITDACANVEGFAQRYDFLVKVMQIESKSLNTIKAYTHHLAKFCIYHHRLPEQVSDYEYVEYYSSLIKGQNASRGQMKHAVFCISYYFRTFDQFKCPTHAKPSIPHDKKLPVVLSVTEIKAMFRVTTNLLHKSALGVMYGAGLRVGEVRNLRIEDIDFGRQVIHVRQGKGRKDRYIPLSKNLAKLLKKYFLQYAPKIYVFENRGHRYSDIGMSYIVKTAAAKAGIVKAVHCHTLRHSFATHQLENGVSILDVQANLGHECLQTTLTYLHVARMPDRPRNITPLDIIYRVSE